LQTGTAERFSKQLGNELRRKYGDGVVVEVVDIENYKAEVRLPKEKLVLYLMATYGEVPKQRHTLVVVLCTGGSL
jgi:NADPH-ferrihemoprotein reductase